MIKSALPKVRSASGISLNPFNWFRREKIKSLPARVANPTSYNKYMEEANNLSRGLLKKEIGNRTGEISSLNKKLTGDINSLLKDPLKEKNEIGSKVDAAQTAVNDAKKVYDDVWGTNPQFLTHQKTQAGLRDLAKEQGNDVLDYMNQQKTHTLNAKEVVRATQPKTQFLEDLAENMRREAKPDFRFLKQLEKTYPELKTSRQAYNKAKQTLADLKTQQDLLNTKDNPRVALAQALEEFDKTGRLPDNFETLLNNPSLDPILAATLQKTFKTYKRKYNRTSNIRDIYQTALRNDTTARNHRLLAYILGGLGLGGAAYGSTQQGREAIRKGYNYLQDQINQQFYNPNTPTEINEVDKNTLPW